MSGVDTIVQMGAQIASVIGPEFDLVGFDARGEVFETSFEIL